MEAKAKIDEAARSLDKIDIFCQNILKHGSKLRYYEEKLSSLKYMVNQSANHKHCQHLKNQDLQQLQLHGLSPQSIRYLPQFKFIIMLLINLFIITLTLTHWIFLPVIKNFQNIISAYLYISLFLGTSFLAGLCFRARRVNHSFDDKLWSALSLLMLCLAYFAIRCLFFHYENFPNQFFINISQQLFNLFFSVPSTLILKFYLTIYLILAVAIFYVSSYLSFGSPDVSKIVKNYPLHSFFTDENLTEPEETSASEFNLKKIQNTIKSVQKFQEKLLIELQNESAFNAIEIDEIQLTDLTEFESIQEKIIFLCSAYSDEPKLIKKLQQVKSFIQGNQSLKSQMDELLHLFPHLDTQTKEEA